jgi:7-cyano-7-deazaguanine synthase
MKKAIVVLSGGQDSTTCLFWAIREYGVANVLAVTFDYGQRHQRELEAANIVAEMAGVTQLEVEVGPILKGTSPLTNRKEQLETYENYEQMDKIIGDRVEKTFVPMRNALFLTLAANRAVVHDCNVIVTGVCQQDNANYPDCRYEFIASQENTINQALGYIGRVVSDPRYIEIVTPLMDLTKAESIKLAQSLPGCMEALAFSHTAYDGGYPPVSKDHASILRAQGFVEAGVPDPLVLRAIREGLMDAPDTPNYEGFRTPSYGLQNPD